MYPVLVSEAEDPIQSALSARGAGPVLERVPTARRVALPSLDGRPASAPLTLARTPGQVWLVAAREPPDLDGLAHAVAVGVGGVGAARLDGRLGRATAVVGPVRAPIDSSTHREAEALLTAFRTDAGGPEHPFDPALTHTPSAPHWLLLRPCDTRIELPGVVRDLQVGLQIGLATEGIFVVPEGSSAGLRLPHPLTKSEHWGRPRLEAPGVVLEGGLLEHALFELLARASRHPEAPSELFAALLDGPGPVEAAARALLEHVPIAGDAPVLAAHGEGASAAAALSEHLSVFGSFEVWAEAVRLAAPVDITRPSPSPLEAPPGAPWPPRTPAEIWSLATWRAHGYDGASFEALTREPELQRARALRAALAREQDPIAAAELELRRADALEAEEPATAAAALLRAAQDFERAGQAERGLEAARRASRLHPIGEDTLRRAATCPAAAPEEASWWHHLAHVLDRAPPAGAPRSPCPQLSRAELMDLDPGVGGWLSDLKVRLATPPLPARDQLIRGLERLEAGDPVHERVAALSEAMGLEPVPTYLFRGDEPIGISAWPTSPPVLLVGAAHCRTGDRRALEGAALDFALAVELAHIAAGHPVLAFDDSLVGTSRSVYQAFGRYAGTAETAVDLVSLIPGIDQLAKIQRLIVLSRRVFKAKTNLDKAGKLANPLVRKVAPPLPAQRGLTRDGLVGSAARLRQHADRVGLRLVGDVDAATRAVLATGSAAPRRLDTFDRSGLSALLTESPSRLGMDEVVRLGLLFEDAAGWEMP